MGRRVKELVLHMDHCIQCIRNRAPRPEYVNRCYGDPFNPRAFTEAEFAAFRDGTLSIPDWCPLPDAAERTA